MLVGDDFRFGAQRAGDYDLLDRTGQAQGFEVARMNSYEVHGVRVSSTEVRAALAAGDMAGAERLLGRPYTISGHVVHGRKLAEPGRKRPWPGRWFSHSRTPRFDHWKPAASGIFAVLVHGLAEQPLPGVANLGIRPSARPQRCERRPRCCWKPTAWTGRRTWAAMGLR